MKKRTSNVSRRIVSLLMSLVLTLTLVTPAAFAEGDMPDNGQQQEQQEQQEQQRRCRRLLQLLQNKPYR